MKLPRWSDFPTTAKVYLVLLIPLGLIPLGCFIYFYEPPVSTYAIQAAPVVTKDTVLLQPLPELHQSIRTDIHNSRTAEDSELTEAYTEAPYDYLASLSQLEEEDEPHPDEWVTMQPPYRETGMRDVDWVGLISAINTGILSWAAFFYKRRSDRKRGRRLVCEYED